MKLYFIGFDVMHSNGSNPPPLYEASEARPYNNERMANATCKLLIEDTDEPHFLEKRGEEFFIYKMFE